MISSPKPAQRQTKSPSQRAFALFTTDPSGFFGFVPVIRLFGRFRRIPHGHDGKRTDIFRQIQLFAQGIHHALHRRGAAIAGSDAVSPGGQHQTLCGNSAVDIDEAPFFIFFVAVERLFDIAADNDDTSGVLGKRSPALNVAEVCQKLLIVNHQKFPRLFVVSRRRILRGLDYFFNNGFINFLSWYLRIERLVKRPSINSIL